MMDYTTEDLILLIKAEIEDGSLLEFYFEKLEQNILDTESKQINGKGKSQRLELTPDSVIAATVAVSFLEAREQSWSPVQVRPFTPILMLHTESE